MRRGNILLVLPKLSAYMLKEYEVQRYLQNTVNEYLDLATSWGKKVYCFGQDMLAVKLLGTNSDIRWVNLVGPADKTFIKSSVTDKPDEYERIHMLEVAQDAIAKAVSRFKVPDPRSFDEYSKYIEHRMGVLQKRIRYVADAITKDLATFVIYLDAGNNFSSTPTFADGDGRRGIIHDTRTGVVNYYYGGFQIDRDAFMQITSLEANA